MGSGGVHFRVWAPRARCVEVALENGSAVALEPEAEGYHGGLVEAAGRGTRYRLRLGSGRGFPDPASRFQPDGPHGPSCVIDPSTFCWSDGEWNGVRLEGQVLYEMHVGTFTPEGTWAAAARELPELARIGITVIELMPVADFPGRFGWGYDGVDLFAPTRLYGEPDDFRRFVDLAHGLGLGVILDVVYNHLGPDGNYLKEFSEHYFTDRYSNEWGEAVNFDGEGSGPVRDFVLDNAAYWIEEYHLDGLRLDATQQIYDASPEHILTALARRVRSAAGGRATLLVAENEPQDVRLVRPVEDGGYGLDALWNDDFHHAAVVALTGLNAAYYSDYHGAPQEFISVMKWGFLYQGQRYRWDSEGGGVPLARKSRRDPEASEPDVAGRSVGRSRSPRAVRPCSRSGLDPQGHQACQRSGHALPVAHERERQCGPPRIEIRPQGVLMLEPLHGGGRGVVATDRGHQQSARKAGRGGRVPAAVQQALDVLVQRLQHILRQIDRVHHVLGRPRPPLPCSSFCSGQSPMAQAGTPGAGGDRRSRTPPRELDGAEHVGNCRSRDGRGQRYASGQTSVTERGGVAQRVTVTVSY